jgi:AcrR family transcriptional regulator
MYKLCKTEGSTQRQKEIEQILLTLMREKSYDEISVTEICDRANMPRKSFYRYFDGKEGALHALLDHTLMDYESAPVLYSEGESRTLAKDMEQFFVFWIDQKPLLDALQRSGLSGVLIERAIAQALGEVAVPGRFLKAEAPGNRQYVTMFGVCGLMSMVLQWHHGGYQESPGNMAMVAIRLLTCPLFPNAEKLL